MDHTPSPKGQRISVKKVSATKWDAEGNFTFTCKIKDPPPLSASKKCYLLAFRQGETDIVMNIDGVDRKIRMTLILYAKVPAKERLGILQQQAQDAEASGVPKLF